MISEFGARLVRFVGTKLKGIRAPGQGAAGGKFDGLKAFRSPRPKLFLNKVFILTLAKIWAKSLKKNL